MEYYRLGSLFLDISLGLLVVGAIVRLIVAAKYFKSNGNKKLNEVQIKKCKYSLKSGPVAHSKMGHPREYAKLIKED